MEFVKRISIGMITGALFGLVVGVLLAFVFAPRHWVTIPWITNVASQATFGGGVSGVFTGIVSWVLYRKATSDRVFEKLNRVLPQKASQVIWGIIHGVVLGSISGMIVEAIVNIGRLLSSPNGMHFLISDFSLVLFVSPVLGAIVGVAYGIARKPLHKAVGKLRGISSGIIFGGGASILWVAFTCWWVFTDSLDVVTYGYATLGIAIGTVCFGILVGVVSEMILGHRTMSHSDLPTEAANTALEQPQTSV